MLEGEIIELGNNLAGKFETAFRFRLLCYRKKLWLQRSFVICIGVSSVSQQNLFSKHLNDLLKLFNCHYNDSIIRL